MHDRSDVMPALIKLPMDAGFVGRLQETLSWHSAPVQISKDNVLLPGEKKPCLFSAATANEHTPAIDTARAYMPGGFFEKTEFGENPAGQCDVFC